MVRITKSIAEKRLDDVSQEIQFWCEDGRYLKNLKELKEALEQMTEEIYRYHVNETKSDFSDWVKDVIGDEKLARDLRKSSTKAQAARRVAERIVFLREK